MNNHSLSFILSSSSLLAKIYSKANVIFTILFFTDLIKATNIEDTHSFAVVTLQEYEKFGFVREEYDFRYSRQDSHGSPKSPASINDIPILKIKAEHSRDFVQFLTDAMNIDPSKECSSVLVKIPAHVWLPKNLRSNVLEKAEYFDLTTPPRLIVPKSPFNTTRAQYLANLFKKHKPKLHAGHEEVCFDSNTNLGCLKELFKWNLSSNMVTKILSRMSPVKFQIKKPKNSDLIVVLRIKGTQHNMVLTKSVKNLLKNIKKRVSFDEIQSEIAEEIKKVPIECPEIAEEIEKVPIKVIEITKEVSEGANEFVDEPVEAENCEVNPHSENDPDVLLNLNIENTDKFQEILEQAVETENLDYCEPLTENKPDVTTDSNPEQEKIQNDSMCVLDGFEMPALEEQIVVLESDFQSDNLQNPEDIPQWPVNPTQSEELHSTNPLYTETATSTDESRISVQTCPLRESAHLNENEVKHVCCDDLQVDAQSEHCNVNCKDKEMAKSEFQNRFSENEAINRTKSDAKQRNREFNYDAYISSLLSKPKKLKNDENAWQSSFSQKRASFENSETSRPSVSERSKDIDSLPIKPLKERMQKFEHFTSQS